MAQKYTPVQRAFALFGALSFFSTTAIAGFRLFQSVLSPATPAQATPTVAPTPVSTQPSRDNLELYAQSYENILKREPNNQIALENLARIRVEMQDPQGAIKPLETLTQLYPERSDYQQALSRVQQQVKETSTK